MQTVKTKSVEALDAENLPIYNAGDRCGPRSRRFVEVTRQKALENAGRKKPFKGLSATTCGRIRTQGAAVEKIPFESKK